ncbi:hypothetical protein [Longimicrobium sp.]|uniref:hypothetical protein n=1 Tax=Longimicrobium sp. TaxID=2029185 RepID=UPI002E2F8558|nr:hypothetical protein [Longimicrobium sp.]HEX6037645.1 hypothetical protein [Longimicrobium sp.]
MSPSHRSSRPRLLLALLLAALLVGVVPVHASAPRSEKSPGVSAWRAASARPVQPPRGDADLGGAPLPAVLPELLPVSTIIRAPAPRAPRTPRRAAPFARSPLPRAPPAA